MTIRKLKLWVVIAAALLVIVTMGYMAFFKSTDKANNIWEVIVVQDNVPYYEEKSTDSHIVGKLNAGDKIKMFAATAYFVTTEIDGEIRYVETRLVDLTASTRSKQEIEDIWASMYEAGITPAGKYTGKPQQSDDSTPVKEDASTGDARVDLQNWFSSIHKKVFGLDNKGNVIAPTPTPTPTVPDETKKPEPISPPVAKKKDTVNFVHLPAERADNSDPYSIYAINYTTTTATKLYKTASSNGSVFATVEANETLKVSDTNMKFVAANRTKVNEWLEVVYYGQKLYVKRADIITNYEVYISPKAKTWNYNYRNSNGIVTDSYASYDSGSLVTVNDIPHDPIYDLLNAGTTVMPSAITNSSVIKPKAGTGASTTTYIPSTGTASGDGWKAPTFSKNIYDGIFKDVFSFDLGFRNTYDHFGVVFETTDGSRLDVLVLNPDKYIGGFEVKGLTKKEGYRTKEMLRVTIPFFFEKSEAKEAAKIHNDFLSYVNSGATATKVVNYKGFKAEFKKTATDAYTLYMSR